MANEFSTYWTTKTEDLVYQKFLPFSNWDLLRAYSPDQLLAINDDADYNN
jgi:hypothetical protein